MEESYLKAIFEVLVEIRDELRAERAEKRAMHARAVQNAEAEKNKVRDLMGKIAPQFKGMI